MFPMRQALLTFFVLACWPLYAEIEVTFPVEAKPKDGTKLDVTQGWAPDDSLEAVRIDGVLAYYSGARKYAETQKSESFDKLKEGMTLKEIVSLLGPGFMDMLAGVGYISWYCEDGRVLLLRRTLLLNEKDRYHISLSGTGQRSEDVARLAKALISSIHTTKLKVEVTLTQDTHQAKAGQVRTYEVGQMFQKADPLPRIDFYITKIEGDSVYCQYFYQAPPEGLLHYRENGNLILSNREQGGADQPSNHPESKPEAGQTPISESEGRSK